MTRGMDTDYGNQQIVAPGSLPPSIIPVIILKGSDYEMGCQYGQQVGHYIEMKKDALWVSAFEMFSYDRVLHELKGYQYYIEEYTPEQIVQMKGMADGASAAGYQISYLDVLLINSYMKSPTPAYTYPTGAEKDEIPPLMGACSNWAAWGSTTTDGRLICGGARDGDFDYEVTIVAFPEDGNSYLGVARAGEVAGHLYINNKGVYLGGSGGYGMRDVDYNYGLPYSCQYQHIMRFADSASEAKDMFLSAKHSVSASLLLADVSDNAFVVEYTAALQEVRKPGDFGETNFIYAANNYLTDQLQAALESGGKYIEHGGWLAGVNTISSVPRNLEMWNMFYNYQGKVDLDFARMMWRFPGNPPPYPLNVEAYVATQGKEWDQKICNLCNGHVGIGLPDAGDNGVMYICTGPAGRIAYPLTPIDHDWYQADLTYSFYQLALNSSPARVVGDARNQAHAYIAEVYQKLMWLKHTDTGYTALNQLFSLANTEYYEGINAYNKGALTSGNTALLCFAQAATAFTRSQAHARQAYNALVPPATSPDDLGLPDWFGDWGQWATRGF